MSAYHVYILLCADGSFYAGFCEHLVERIAAHQCGKGATWTAKRRPIELVYAERFATKSEAVAREKQLKGWTHAKKEALVNGDTQRLRSLSKRRE